MVKLTEVEVKKFPGVKVWFAVDGGLPLMVRINEVAQTPERLAAIYKFMRGQTCPTIEGASPQDYIYLHDYDNFLYNERTGKLKFWD